MALIEFALVLPMLLILALATLDFGRLIQTRLIISNVSREGGSIASRETSVDTVLTSLLQASGSPLDLGGPDGKVFITRIAAGQSTGVPAPAIATQINRGSLGVSSRIAANRAYLGLTQPVYDHLVFNTTNGASDISEVTVVEVFYKYRPITPLSNLIPGVLTRDAGGIIVWSKAVF